MIFDSLKRMLGSSRSKSKTRTKGRTGAISPGPLKTRAASGITDFDKLVLKAQSKAPARSLVSIEDVGVAVAFLSMNGAKLITGETLYIDGGYHIID
ncbi:MAG: SDR family oxidoreductase [Terrimicrobiaceae bacterium]